jgi:hypothetical protein
MGKAPDINIPAWFIVLKDGPQFNFTEAVSFVIKRYLYHSLNYGQKIGQIARTIVIASNSTAPERTSFRKKLQ